jgi:hypothetical protein
VRKFIFLKSVLFFSHVFLKVLTTVHAKFGWNPPLRLKQIGFRWLLPHVATRCIDSSAVAEEGYHRCGLTTLAIIATVVRLLQQKEDDRGKIMIMSLLFRLGYLGVELQFYANNLYLIISR